MKKILGALLGAAVITAHITIPVLAKESSFYWLEAEDATYSSNYNKISNANASGGEYMAVYETSSGEYTVEFNFTNESEGKYDIWFLSGKGTVRKLTKFNWTINDSAKNTASATATDAVYSDIYAENTCDFYWNKIDDKRVLPEGETNIRFIVDKKSEVNTESGEKAWFNYIDAAVVVPSDWKWVPDGLTPPVQPEKVLADFVWIELEDSDAEGKYIKPSVNSNASEGKILYSNAAKPDDGVTEENFSYSFEIDKQKEYDIWYLGIQTNVSYLSSLQWCMDNSGQYVANNVNQTTPTNYTISVAGSSFPMYWQKLGTKEISEGEHVLNLLYKVRNTSPTVFLVAADCAVLVPSELDWMPNEDNLKGEQTKGEIIARVFANNYNEYFNKDFSGITDDIDLPTAEDCIGFKNQLDAEIVFSADEFENKEVISSDGMVTRPFATASGDAQINFYINANYQNKDDQWVSGRYAIPMIVKKWEKYEITKELSVNKQKLSAGDTITASASADIHVGGSDKGTVTVLMVLYDKNGRMQEIAMGEERGSYKKNVSASMTLPEDVQGSVLKVYLLNGLLNANKLGDVITITE